jgi:hypothetical protein
MRLRFLQRECQAISPLGVLVALSLTASACGPYLHTPCAEHWQPSQVLETSDGRPVFVEAPEITPAPEGVLLLGTPALAWAQPNAFDPPPGPTSSDTAAYFNRFRANFENVGFALGPDFRANPVKPPSPIRAGLMRRFTVESGDGQIHVVWFSPAHGSIDPDSADGEIWYAELRKGKWTSPRLVYSADGLSWGWERTLLLVRNNSDIHLLVPYEHNHRGGIAYIRRINGLWTTLEMPLSGLPSEPTLQFIGHDSLVIAFLRIGAPGVRGQNGQHVFLIRASVHDTIWPSATLVHFSGLGAARWLRMYDFHTDRHLHLMTLVWNRVAARSESASDSVYAMTSDNEGLTWQPPRVLPLPFAVANFTQASDSEGNVHIVATALKGGLGATRRTIYHAVLANGNWTDLDSLRDSVTTAPSLSAIGPRALLLIWGSPRPAGGRSPDAIAPVSKYTTLVRTCPIGPQRG